MPLHTFCVWFMGLIAGLVVLAVYGLVRQCTGSRGWALAASLLWAFLPANYRTIGFILIREDLAFPLFALHLLLVVRALGRPSASAFLAAGLAAAAALATWHAMRFFFLLELLPVALGFLLSGRSLFEKRGAPALLVGPVLAGLLVPALRASRFLGSLPMTISLALLVVALATRRRALGHAARLAIAGGALVLFGAAAALLASAGERGAYAHVWQVVWAKLRHLGALPADPTALSFDARLLWQGPFETLAPSAALGLLGWGLAALAAGLFLFRRARLHPEPVEAFLLALTTVALPVAWLFARTAPLAGFLLPVVAAVFLARTHSAAASAARPRAALVLGLAIALQAFSFLGFLRGHVITWYLPPGRQAEIATLVSWVREELPREEAIVGDFMNSTAILAHAGNPIVLQPKYETDRSRRRAEDFLVTFFQGTPEDLRRLVRERFQSRYLLVDRYTLGYLSWYTAGLPERTPRPGTAAEVFLSQDAAVLEGVPGFELVYRSPPTIQQVNGEPYDLYRLYRVD